MSNGYRNLPDDIRAEIAAMGDRPFFFAAVRGHSPELESTWTSGLNLEESEYNKWSGLPRTSGLWSRWNIEGRIKIRKDLPKVWRSWSIESPNFKGNGTHTTTFTREVFSKQYLYGQQVEASVIRTNDSRNLLVGAVLMTLQGPMTPDREDEFLYAASLCRTWFGTVQVLAVDDEGAPEIPDHYFNWEFLPPGTGDELRAAMMKRFGSTATPLEIKTMIDRFDVVQSLHPANRMIGSTGLQKYVGFQFEDDMMVLENPRVGNAIYILYGNWSQLSKLSRSELLSGRFGNDFDRIVHSSGWIKKLRLAVYSHRNTKP